MNCQTINRDDEIGKFFLRILSWNSWILLCSWKHSQRQQWYDSMVLHRLRHESPWIGAVNPMVFKKRRQKTEKVNAGSLFWRHRKSLSCDKHTIQHIYSRNLIFFTSCSVVTKNILISLSKNYWKISSCHAWLEKLR